jgi:hypothetical protein
MLNVIRDKICLIYGSTALCWALAAFQFLNLYAVGRTGDQAVARPLPRHRTTQTQNKRTQTSMPRMGFEPTTPVFERAETVLALDRAATVVGRRQIATGINDSNWGGGGNNKHHK